ncbi:MAG: glutamate racemase [Enterobacteriaceae bacterium]
MAITQQEGNFSSKPPINFKDNSVRQPPTVLIFDSGVGGLSVYDEIRQLLPDLNYIYLFDNACFPYGERSGQFIVDRVVDITAALQQHHHLDMVVVACNTASTVSLEALRSRFHIPIVGVVPAIKPAAQLTRNKVVGVLATKATVQRSYTHDLVSQFATGCKVEFLGSSKLVVMAEGKLRGEAVDLTALKEILQPWLTLSHVPDTIVLGCTHFPLLRDELLQILPQGTVLIDSGAAIARRVNSLLGKPLHRENRQGGLIYCTRLDGNAMKLQPIFSDYGFGLLNELPTL